MRQRWARSLVEEYGYPISDLGIEVTIAIGTARPRCDVVIYRNGAPHNQENIQYIVEAKRDDVLPSDAGDGEDQLKSYMAACIGCGYGLWVGSERRAFQKTRSGCERVSDNMAINSRVSSVVYNSRIESLC